MQETPLAGEILNKGSHDEYDSEMSVENIGKQ
jgi:hypothetical protein